MATPDSRYCDEIAQDVAATIQDLQCQPILFIGTGLSRRYFGAPSWAELLERLIDDCPLITKPYAFFHQTYDSPTEIGEEVARAYHEWAWGDGHSHFPESLFQTEANQHDFVKHYVASLLVDMTPSAPDTQEVGEFVKEIAALKNVSPHAVITTNYDTYLEGVFPDFDPIVGETVLRGSYACVGEIFKIHGCVTQPTSLVFSTQDYDAFVKRRKYLSAKLMTFFAEHPLLFVGYSASDPNITHILSDIDAILAADGELIQNIYILEWAHENRDTAPPPREKVLHVGNGRTIRIKSITASDFSWVFESFAAQAPLQKVNVKLLRSLMSRAVELVRHDIPRRTIKVDYTTLEHALETSDNLSSVLGIQTERNATSFNADYPYTLSELAKKLKGKHWSAAQKLLQRIKDEKGVDIKVSDNRYHIANKHGKSVFHKYSESAVDLLEKVKSDEEYTVFL